MNWETGPGPCRRSLRTYGYLAELKEPDDDGYFRYRAVERET
ncbi:MAG: hypothetical protein Q8P31_13955 [Bacillota bacterium]|nr:hypothetical protein [Bacillota bacterium]